MNLKKRKIFNQRRRRLPMFLLVLVGLLAMSSCAPRSNHWIPEESPKRNKVDWAKFYHVAQFSPGSSILSEAQERDLERFLRRVALGQGVRVEISSSEASDVRLGLRREAAVADVLERADVRVSLAKYDTTEKTPDHSVRVAVGRYVLTSPKCPDWSKAATGDPSNRVSGNFGCATASNHGLMLANPGDLVRPGPLTSGDGEALAKGLQNYRAWEEEKAPAVTTLSIQSSGGSGQ
jgi:pilus assembly protein CpaD